MLKTQTKAIYQFRIRLEDCSIRIQDEDIQCFEIDLSGYAKKDLYPKPLKILERVNKMTKEKLEGIGAEIDCYERERRGFFRVVSNYINGYYINGLTRAKSDSTSNPLGQLDASPSTTPPPSGLTMKDFYLHSL